MAQPLYKQISEVLFGQIHSGELQPGDRLPSENELSEHFEAGRNTIRHALSELALQGVVESVQGVGTFVVEQHYPKTAEELYGFSQEMAQRGKQVTSKVLDAQIIEADPFLARRLRVQLGAEVVFLNRLRMMDAEPAATERAYLPHTCCEGILEHDFSTESLYEVLSDEYGMKPDHAEQEILAEVATPQVSKLLNLESPAAVLVIRRETRTVDGEVIEYVESEFRADRFRFFSSLKVSPSSPVKSFQRFPVQTGGE